MLPLFILALAFIAGIVSPDDDDPILDHYSSRAASVFDTRNPWRTGAVFSFEARTLLKKYIDDSYVTTDSMVSRHWYSFGQLDSQVVLRASDDGLLNRVDFSYPNVFEGEYRFNFFPNDTGGKTIALGFDVVAEEARAPAGLAVIDRDYYYLHRLYLYYPDRKNYRKYSRSFRFVEEKGMIVADSIWVVASRFGLLSNEYFRIETNIYDIRVRP